MGITWEQLVKYYNEMIACRGRGKLLDEWFENADGTLNRDNCERVGLENVLNLVLSIVAVNGEFNMCPVCDGDLDIIDGYNQGYTNSVAEWKCLNCGQHYKLFYSLTHVEVD